MKRSICIVRSNVNNGKRDWQTETYTPVDGLVSLMLQELTCLFAVTEFTATRLVLENRLSGSETVVTGRAEYMLPVLKGLYLAIDPSLRSDVLCQTGDNSPWKYSWDLEPMDALAAKLEVSALRKRYRLRSTIMAAFGMTDVDAIITACTL